VETKQATLTIVMALLAAPALSWAGTGEPDDQLWTELRVVAPLASNTTVTGRFPICLLARNSSNCLSRQEATERKGLHHRRGETRRPPYRSA